MGNLFWGNHFADLANRHKARTQSPLSLCRFAKNYESTTAITSIVFHAIWRFGANLNAPESSQDSQCDLWQSKILQKKDNYETSGI